MPTIKQYGTPTQSIRQPTFARQQKTGNQLSGIASGLDSVANEIADAALEEKKKLDTARTTASYAQWNDETREAHYGENGYLTRTGSNSFGIYDEQKDYFDESRSRYMEGLDNDEQRAAFNRMTEARRASYLDAGQKHATRERERYQVEATTAYVDSEINSALEDYQNPKRISSSLITIHGAIESNLEGKPPEVIAGAKREASDKFMEAVIERYINEDPTKARDALEAHRGAVSGAKYQYLSDKIEGNEINYEVTRLFHADGPEAATAYYNEKKRELGDRARGSAVIRTSKGDVDLTAIGSKYNVPTSVMWAIAQNETGGLKDRAGATSETGVKGLFQVTGGTFKEMNVGTDRTDPNQSAEAGAKYLSQLYKKYGNWELVAMAYNGGPGTVDKAIEKCGAKSPDCVAQNVSFVGKDGAVSSSKNAEIRGYLAKFRRNMETGNFGVLHDALARAGKSLGALTAKSSSERAAIKRTADDAIYVLDRGKTPPDLQSVIDTVKGTEHEHRVEIAMQDNEAVTEFMQNGYSAQAIVLEQLRTVDTVSKQQLKRIEKFEKAHKDLGESITEGAPVYAETAGLIDDFTPINWQNYGSVATDIGVRNEVTRTASAHAGIQLSPLTGAEAQSLKSKLDDSTVDEKLDLLQNIGSTFDPDVANAAFSSLGLKSPAYGVAGELLAGGDRKSAERILDGMAQAEADKKLLPEKDDVDGVNNTLLELFPDMPSKRTKYETATKYIYASMAADGDEDIDRAIEQATGGIVTTGNWNPFRENDTIIAPFIGASNGETNDWLRSIDEDGVDMMGGAYLPTRKEGSDKTELAKKNRFVADLISGGDANLVSIDRGRYWVFYGTRPILDASGNRFVLRYEPTVEVYE